MEGSVKYVTLNLISSALFLAGIGVLYGMAGTLNMAQLAEFISHGGSNSSVALSSALFLAGFGIKAGYFPSVFLVAGKLPNSSSICFCNFFRVAYKRCVCIDPSIHINLCSRCRIYTWSAFGTGDIYDDHGRIRSGLAI